MDWWRHLGPEAPQVIISMYQEESMLTHRLHLLKGLGAFSDAQSANFLEQQATETQDSVVRNQAIRAVGNSQGPAAADFIGRFLNSPDSQTRLAAAETLKGMKDAHAQELYSSYLSQEKAPWLVARLKGQTSKPLSLTPVSSSEDRVNPELEGTWRGYWIEPRTDRAGGMQSHPAIVHLKVSGATEVSGDALLKEKTKVRNFAFSKILGKGSKVSGSVAEELPKPAPTPAPSPSLTPLAFEAELKSVDAGGPQLELRIPKIGATLVLRKDAR